MNAYQLFRICQGALGRKYRGTIEEFKQLNCAAYYHTLNDFLTDKFGNNDRKKTKYIKICENEFGSRFDPFHLMTEEYMSVYNEWVVVHEDSTAYKKHILKSIQNIYSFCRDRDIKTLEEYVQRWGVSHITSGVLDENVAFVLKVHKIYLSKPEKTLIKKKFLNNITMIESRLVNEKDLQKLIIKNLEVARKKLLKD